MVEVPLKILLDHGANIEAKDNGGWTPLMHAARNRGSVTVKILLDHGANIEAKNNEYRTAAWYAVEEGHSVVELSER
jgi:ankyrin repeat protein